MGIQLTVAQLAERIADDLDGPDGRPHVGVAQARALVHMGLFPRVGSGRSIRVDLHQVDAVLYGVRFVSDPAGYFDRPAYRVSLREPEPDVVSLGSGKPLRTYKGVDYSALGPPNASTLGGYEGVWSAKLETCELLVATGGLLIGSGVGYVAPELVRTIKGWTDIDHKHRYFHTEPAPKTVKDAVGRGLWIGIPRGALSTLL